MQGQGGTGRRLSPGFCWQHLSSDNVETSALYSTELSVFPVLFPLTEVEELGMEADGQKEQLSRAEGGDTTSQDSGLAQLEEDSAVSNGRDSESEKEHVEFKIIWNKNKYDVKLPLDSTGASLKQKIHTLTGV